MKRSLKQFIFLLALFVPVAFAISAPYPACQQSLMTWVKTNMEKYAIAGASVAVIDKGKVTCVANLGYSDKRRKELVDAKTRFNAASIAKPLSALAALQIFKAYKLNLNVDINRYLTSWKIPANKFSQQAFVTMRNLLSHSAGVTGFRCKGYPQGTPLPTLKQALEGEPPANTPKVILTAKPNTRYLYSPAGYMIVQQALMDVTQLPFNTLMQRYLFKALAMKNSTFQQPPFQRKSDKFAYPYLPNGDMVKGGPLRFAAQAAGTLWTTSTDLAKFLLAVQSALDVKADSNLNKKLIQTYLTPGLNANMALGILVNLDKFGDDKTSGSYFGHSGWNSGYLSYIIASKKDGVGLVILTNTAPLMTDKGQVKQFEFIKGLNRKVAELYHWQ